jgi:CRISPR-associated endoribonuclease Cas6
MLLSLLFSLTPTQSAPVLGPLGRPIQAWFLSQLTRFQPELAKALHDLQGPKPYTVSSLLDERGRPLPAGRWLQPGEDLWLRLTSFHPELSQILMKNFLPKHPSRINLYKMPFRVNGFTLDPAQSDWAGSSNFQDLSDRVGMDNPTRQARLEFASPTAFRSQGADIPLPDPNHVFRGLWQKWNAFSPEALQVNSTWPEFAAASVKVSEITGLNTERWRFSEGTRGASTGFTGTVTFTLLPPHMCKGFEEVWEGADQILRLLSAFAFYCGTGHHTTIGMGQTRLLPGRSPQKLFQHR